MILVSFRTAGIIICLLLLLTRIPVRGRPLALLAGSMLFYADSPELLALHMAYTALTLTLAFFIQRFKTAKYPLLTAGILIHCMAFVWLRGKSGFSYSALIHVGFLLDISHESKPGGVIESAAALMYFPCLQEGPVIDAFTFREKLLLPEPPSWERCSLAALRIVTGLIKKLVIADRLAPFVETAFAAPQNCRAFTLWMAVLFYTIQIYMDFSGCMDIVLGVSSMAGIDLPENFQRPYLADSCSEYWRRWHITMGNWFRHRVFYPLAMSVPVLKVSGWLVRTFQYPTGAVLASALPLLFTWILVGLWHGFEPHYIVWGAANGLMILAESAWQKNRPHWPKAARIMRTFFAMSFIRILFRADSIEKAGSFYRCLFRFSDEPLPFALPDCRFLAAAVFAAVFIMLEIRSEYRGVQKLPVPAALFFSAAGIILILIFGRYGPGYSPTEFYYNRF